MTQYIVYTLPNCPNCEKLKKQLEKKEIEFEVKDLSEFQNMAKLRQKGVFISEAPVLQIDDIYYISHEIKDVLYQVYHE